RSTSGLGAGGLDGQRVADRAADRRPSTRGRAGAPRCRGVRGAPSVGGAPAAGTVAGPPCYRRPERDWRSGTAARRSSGPSLSSRPRGGAGVEQRAEARRPGRVDGPRRVHERTAEGGTHPSRRPARGDARCPPHRSGRGSRRDHRTVGRRSLDPQRATGPQADQPVVAPAGDAERMSTGTVRVDPVRPPFPPELQAGFDKIMPPGVPPLTLLTTLARVPRIYERFRAGSLLDRGPLSLRHREIVIDRTCARCGCAYEWGVHVAFFAERLGLTPAQQRATVHGTADDPA